MEEPATRYESGDDPFVGFDPHPRLRSRQLAGLGQRMTWAAGLALAISAFTGWYSSPGDDQGVEVSVLGWDTGLLGKLVLLIGIVAVVLVILRETGIQLPAAVPESLMVIALGALGTIVVLVRLISIPDEFFFADRGVGLAISLVAALALLAAGLLEAADEL